VNSVVDIISNQELRSPRARDGRTTVYNEFLIPDDRKPRLPLPLWARKVLCVVCECEEIVKRDIYAASGPLIGCLNEAALIEVYYGRLPNAGDICQAAMNWSYLVLLRTGRLSAAQFALQPYVNCGRLDRICRRWDDSIDKFKSLLAIRTSSPLAIGPIGFTCEHWAQVLREAPQWEAILESVYIVDTLKTLIRATRFVDVLEMVKANIRRCREALRDVLCEAATIALIHLGSSSTALEITEAYLRDSHPMNPAIFVYRRAEVLEALGETARSHDLYKKLAAAFLTSNAQIGLSKLNLATRVAERLAHCCPEHALVLVRLALPAAQRLNDVLFQKELLRILRECAANSEDVAQAARQLDSLELGSCYGAANSPASPRNGQTTVIDALSERLLGMTTENAMIRRDASSFSLG
jgi:hypothetical protein